MVSAFFRRKMYFVHNSPEESSALVLSQQVPWMRDDHLIAEHWKISLEKSYQNETRRG